MIQTSSNTNPIYFQSKGTLRTTAVCILLFVVQLTGCKRWNYEYCEGSYGHPSMNSNNVEEFEGTAIYPLACLVADHNNTALRAELGSFDLATLNMGSSTKDYSLVDYALFCANYEAIQILVEHGLDVYSERKHGNSPMLSPMYMRDSCVFYRMIEGGADLNATVSNLGKEYHLSEYVAPYFGLNAYKFAVESGLETVVKLNDDRFKMFFRKCLLHRQYESALYFMRNLETSERILSLSSENPDWFLGTYRLVISPMTSSSKKSEEFQIQWPKVKQYMDSLAVELGVELPDYGI